jgi:hypothetical protein
VHPHFQGELEQEAIFSWKGPAQYGLKRGLWTLPFPPFFFLALQSFGRHMLHRVLLQYWQKLQSGQGFFLRIFFSTVN